MENPFSVIGTLIGVAQTTGNIVFSCYEYLQYLEGVQTGRHEVANILQEVQLLRNNVESLIELRNGAGNELLLPSLKDEAFVRCQNGLDHLESQLRTPISNWERLSATLLWPLKKPEVEKTLENIHRMRTIIQDCLETDNTRLALETQKNTVEIKNDTVELKTSTSEMKNDLSLIKTQTSIVNNDTSEILNNTKLIIDIQRSGVVFGGRKKLKELPNWLKASAPSVKHNEVHEKRAKNTGLSLLESTVFRNWRDSEDMSSLCLYGIPGCGKTVLSSIVMEHIKDRNTLQGRNGALAYFYFDFSNVTTSKSKFMLPSLIAQLSEWKGTLPAALADYVSKQSSATGAGHDNFIFRPDGIAQPSTQHLVEIFRGIVEEYEKMQKCEGIYIVIDALDECVDQDELLAILKNILTWEVKGLHIFLTRRHALDIANSSDGKITRTVEAGIENVDKDIELFIREQLDRHPKLRQWPPKVRSEIQETLQNGAKGMFRWVDCHIQILEKCTTVKGVREALRELPTSLSETYLSTLTSMEACHRENVIKILMWLAVSLEPPNLKEAVDFLAIDFSKKDHPVFDQDLRMLNEKDILTMCTTLITTTHTCSQGGNGESDTNIELHLAHYTVKEWLLEKATKFHLPTRSFGNMHGVHAYVAMSSLAYLLSFKEPLTMELRDEHPLLWRAAGYWIYHYNLWSKNNFLRRSKILFEDCLFRKNFSGGVGTLAEIFLRDGGETEPCKNWCTIWSEITPAILRHIVGDLEPHTRDMLKDLEPFRNATPLDLHPAIFGDPDPPSRPRSTFHHQIEIFYRNTYTIKVEHCKHLSEEDRKLMTLMWKVLGEAGVDPSFSSVEGFNFN